MKSASKSESAAGGAGFLGSHLCERLAGHELARYDAAFLLHACIRGHERRFDLHRPGIAGRTDYAVRRRNSNELILLCRRHDRSMHPNDGERPGLRRSGQFGQSRRNIDARVGGENQTAWRSALGDRIRPLAGRRRDASATGFPACLRNPELDIDHPAREGLEQDNLVRRPFAGTS